MVQKLNGISIVWYAERSAMPVTMPGSAMGKMSSSEIASRPKNRVRARPAAASVPSTMASAVDTSATRNDRPIAVHTSSRSQAAANHFVVRAGGGNT